MKIIKGCFKNLYIYNNFIVISCDPLLKRDHCRLIQCSRSNRPRYCKKSERAMGVVIISPLTGLCKENWPLSYVSLVRATYCTIWSGQYGDRVRHDRFPTVSGIWTKMWKLHGRFTTVSGLWTNYKNGEDNGYPKKWDFIVWYFRHCFFSTKSFFEEP